MLFQGVNLEQAQNIIVNSNFFILAFSIIFFILSSFAIGFALQGSLKATEAAPPFRSTMLANFGGQLLSDITPAKSGYFATPLLLNQLKGVPIEKGLISVMAVGAGNFFVKATFSAIALVYFLNRIPASILNPTMTNALLIGVAILLICGIGLTILVWTNYFSGLILKLCKIPLIGNLIKKIESIRLMFSKDKTALRSSIKITVASVIASVMFSAISLFLLSRAIGMNQLTFIDLLFMGPLTAAFMYVPITFAGLGLQEAAYVFLITGISSTPQAFAVTFALMVRLIAVTTDLIGLPPIIKTGTGLLSKMNKQNEKRSELENKECPKIK